MDHSVTRRGAPCWFRNNDVQLIAINDSFILESCVFKILKRYFGQELFYPPLVDLLIEVCTFFLQLHTIPRSLFSQAWVDIFLYNNIRPQVTRQTELGQLLDLTSQPLDGAIDLSRFTLERYISIVKYKTAFYSFYLPVALGTYFMYVCMYVYEGMYLLISMKLPSDDHGWSERPWAVCIGKEDSTYHGGILPDSRRLLGWSLFLECSTWIFFFF